MGSFVYAMPNVSNKFEAPDFPLTTPHSFGVLLIQPQHSNGQTAICTALVTWGSSIEYANRLSKILARKLKRPVYVGCSINFAGITVEEEMEGLTKLVEVISKHIEI